MFVEKHAKLTSFLWKAMLQQVILL